MYLNRPGQAATAPTHYVPRPTVPAPPRGRHWATFGGGPYHSRTTSGGSPPQSLAVAKVHPRLPMPVVALLNGCAPRGQDADQIAAALAGVDVQVAPVRIRQRMVFARSLLAGQVAQEAEPDGRAAQEVAAVLAFIACT